MGMNTGPSLVGVAKASGATSRVIAFACAGWLVLFSFVPKIAALFLVLPLSVVGSALVFTASFMIAGGIQIMVSRNIDTRMTYVIGISLVLGLSKDVYTDYFSALPPYLHPLTGSMLSLTLIVALGLNLLFRIGIRRRDAFALGDKDLAIDEFAAFLAARGKTWGVTGDVVERATQSTLQVLEHLASAHLVQGQTRAEVGYDELTLAIVITYEGSLLTLPNVGVRRRIFLEEESFSFGLADFLTGGYPERMESSA